MYKRPRIFDWRGRQQTVLLPPGICGHLVWHLCLRNRRHSSQQFFFFRLVFLVTSCKERWYQHRDSQKNGRGGGEPNVRVTCHACSLIPGVIDTDLCVEQFAGTHSPDGPIASGELPKKPAIRLRRNARTIHEPFHIVSICSSEFDHLL